MRKILLRLANCQTGSFVRRTVNIFQWPDAAEAPDVLVVLGQGTAVLGSEVSYQDTTLQTAEKLALDRGLKGHSSSSAARVLLILTYGAREVSLFALRGV